VCVYIYNIREKNTIIARARLSKVGTGDSGEDWSLGFIMWITDRVPADGLPPAIRYPRYDISSGLLRCRGSVARVDGYSVGRYKLLYYISSEPAVYAARVYIYI